MRGSAVCVWGFMLCLTSACPTAHRREGTLDRAAGADMDEMLEDLDCARKVYAEHCLGKEQSDECQKACGE
jgi:hypothetical protein